MEASGSDLSILGTATIFLESEVLGAVRKQMEVAVIEGVEGVKEVLVSLKLMKMWGMVHNSFPLESVDSFYKRVHEENKYDSTYILYYSVESSTSKPLPPPSKQCELLKQKILSGWKDAFKNKLGKNDRVSIPPVHLSLNLGVFRCTTVVHLIHPIIFALPMTENLKT